MKSSFVQKAIKKQPVTTAAVTTNATSTTCVFQYDVIVPIWKAKTNVKAACAWKHASTRHLNTEHVAFAADLQPDS